MKQGPQIEVVEVLDEDPPIIIVGGRGLGAATAVWIDGSPAPWQAADDDVLRIALRESPTETLILIRTPEGDVAGRLTPNG